MRKIPTVFKRDPADPRRVLPEVVEGCEWVLAGEGRATRKYDGTCVMLDPDGAWWARREVRPGKPAPPGFQTISTDDATGRMVGWEPIAQSPFAKFHTEALGELIADLTQDGEEVLPGTYELIGPKINGNPERRDRHELILHDGVEQVAALSAPLDFDLIRATVRQLGKMGVEGIVWHHPDGRRAKVKARDFPRDP